MILCIRCDKDTKRKMDDLLKKDHYRDYSELISVAISNLCVLDHEVGARGAFVIGESPAPFSVALSADPVKSAKRAAVARPGPPQSQKQKARTASAAPARSAPVRIPDLFLYDGLDKLSIATLDVQEDENVMESFTLDRWLFGQYNKLLPAKANCRALARMIDDHDEGLPLDRAAAHVAEAAGHLGDYLADCDLRHQTGRDEALATAFPRSGADAEKSRARYANQFVGAVNSQGQLSGLLCDYRLAGLSGMGVPPMDHGQDARATLTPPYCIQLTAPGLAFARLDNPVLDQSQDDPAQKFSREETAFLLGHIQRFVPVEAFAFRTLIAAVQEGADTPGKLDEALRVYVPADSNRSLSPSFLTSQRSGALSRMADLGLIGRVRKGVRVSYSITEQGQRFADGG